ncbi:MAG: hypothetical protein LBK99_03555 [Opitutaceae bacterium]|jgi:hypothetical protein|nr:hypothetical protein [Opitutaceae bacterium]
MKTNMPTIITKHAKPALLSIAAALVINTIAAASTTETIFAFGSNNYHASGQTWLVNQRAWTRTGDATNGWDYTVAFNPDTALSPTTARYTGPAFYGGFQLHAAGTNLQAYSDGSSIQRVMVDTEKMVLGGITYEYPYLQTAAYSGSYTGTTSGAGVWLFKQNSFDSNFAAGTNFTIDGLSAITVRHNSGEVDTKWRYVVQIDDIYYVSQTVYNAGTNGKTVTAKISTTDTVFRYTENSVTGTALANLKWAVYDPGTSFMPTSASSAYSTMALENVSAVGVCFYDPGSTVQYSGVDFSFGLLSLEITGHTTSLQIPETSNIAMLLATASALIGCARITRRKHTPKQPT